MHLQLFIFLIVVVYLGMMWLPRQLSQGDHHSLAKDAHVVTHSAAMTRLLTFPDSDTLHGHLEIWHLLDHILPHSLPSCSQELCLSPFSL